MNWQRRLKLTTHSEQTGLASVVPLVKRHYLHFHGFTDSALTAVMTQIIRTYGHAIQISNKHSNQPGARRTAGDSSRRTRRTNTGKGIALRRIGMLALSSIGTNDNHLSRIHSPYASRSVPKHTLMQSKFIASVLRRLRPRLPARSVIVAGSLLLAPRSGDARVERTVRLKLCPGIFTSGRAKYLPRIASAPEISNIE